jgi:hypothetical protein
MPTDPVPEEPVELPELLDKPAPAIEVQDDGSVVQGDETHGSSSD